MDQDSKRKGKEPVTSTTTTQQMISDDEQTPPASPHQPTHASPPHSSTAQPSSSSSLSAEPELNQEPKRLMLSTPDDMPTTQHTPTPRINLSSIPPASRRPFFNPSSGSLSPPHTQQSQQSTGSAATSSSGSVFSYEQNLAAKLRRMKPTERADFRLTSQGKKTSRKKRRREGDQSEAGRTRVRRTPPGSSPLGPGLTPYQRVQKSLAELKDFMNTLANPETSEAPPQPRPLQPLPDPSSGPVAPSTSDRIHAASASSSRTEAGLGSPMPQQNVDPAAADATSSLSGPIAPPTTTDIHAASSSSSSKAELVAPRAGCSSSAASDDDESRWTVEDVIEVLDEFLKRVSITIGAQEMENGLLEIQTRLGVDPSPTWYALMSKSYEDMWESLIDYFNCDALDKSNMLENVLEDQDPSGSGAGPSSAPSS